MKIFGLTLQNIVVSCEDYRELTGEFRFDGEIYLDDIKIGTFSDSIFKYPMEINLDEQYKKKILDIAHRVFKEFPYGIDNSLRKSKTTLYELYDNHPIQGLISQAISIWQLEKTFERVTKQGRTAIVLYDSFDYIKTERYDTVDIYEASSDDDIEQFREQGNIIKVFKSASDFNFN